MIGIFPTFISKVNKVRCKIIQSRMMHGGGNSAMVFPLVNRTKISDVDTRIVIIIACSISRVIAWFQYSLYRPISDFWLHVFFFAVYPIQLKSFMSFILFNSTCSFILFNSTCSFNLTQLVTTWTTWVGDERLELNWMNDLSWIGLMRWVGPFHPSLMTWMKWDALIEFEWTSWLNWTERADWIELNKSIESTWTSRLKWHGWVDWIELDESIESN